MDELDERWAERDKRRAAHEAEMERRRQEHKARPLVERLRDCGTFTAADGLLSYAPPHADDAKEAADEINRLRGLLARLEWAGGPGNSRCPVCPAKPYPERDYRHEPGCWLAEELGR
jgi:hypothetical protein